MNNLQSRQKESQNDALKTYLVRQDSTRTDQCARKSQQPSKQQPGEP